MIESMGPVHELEGPEGSEIIYDVGLRVEGNGGGEDEFCRDNVKPSKLDHCSTPLLEVVHQWNSI